MPATLYLIPSVLHETALETIPAYMVEAIKQCQVFFVEDERTTRRFFKKIWKEMVIDDYKWVVIHKAEAQVQNQLQQWLKNDAVIGIVSDAGCPGVADPGQLLVATAQKAGAVVKPLVGPSSILLALMASGMNGQQFTFHGYLPIDMAARAKAIKEIELLSAKDKSAHIFIETPYRNNQLVETVLKTCQPQTLFCMAVNLTAPEESVKTQTIAAWKQKKTDIHKQPAIFLLQAG
jgi:16S rRNA (cytidine1402-2'-O)-methyltransferase